MQWAHLSLLGIWVESEDHLGLLNTRQDCRQEPVLVRQAPWGCLERWWFLGLRLGNRKMSLRRAWGGAPWQGPCLACWRPWVPPPPPPAPTNSPKSQTRVGHVRRTQEPA